MASRRGTQLSQKVSSAQTRYIQKRPSLVKRVKSLKDYNIQTVSQLSEEQLEEQNKQVLESQYKQEGEKQIKQLDEMIADEQKTIENLREAQSKNYTDYKAELIQEHEARITGLKSIKSQASTGKYDFNQLVSYGIGTQTAGLLQEAERLQLKKYKQQLSDYEVATKTGTLTQDTKISIGSGKVGLIRDGVLIGVEDANTGVSRLPTESEKSSYSIQEKVSSQLSKPTMSSEIQRYIEMGYDKLESTKLATESVKQGGVTFSPEKALNILKSKSEKQYAKTVSDVLSSGKEIDLSKISDIPLVGNVVYEGIGKLKESPVKDIVSGADYLGEKIIEGVEIGAEKTSEYLSQPVGSSDFLIPGYEGLTKGEFISQMPAVQLLSRISEGTDLALEYLSGKIELLAKDKIKLLAEENKENEPLFKKLMKAWYRLEPNWVLEAEANVIPMVVRHGKIGLYLIPYVGQVLAVSDVAKIVKDFTEVEKLADDMFKQSYQDYVTNESKNLGEGERLLTQEEAYEMVYPDLLSGLKKSLFVSGTLSAGFITASVVAGGVKAFDRTRKIKFQTFNDTEATRVFNELKALSKYRSVVETVGKQRGVIREGFENLGLDKINSALKKSFLRNADSIEYSISSQKIIQTIPRKVKIKVPKGSSLSKYADEIYNVDTTTREYYRNGINFIIRLKNGDIKGISIQGITDQPLSSFRNFDNVLKYLKSKRITFSTMKSDEEILTTGVYKLRNNILTKEKEIITKVKRVSPPPGQVVDGIEWYAGITKRSGKARDVFGIGKTELFDVGTTESKFLLQRTKGKPKDVISLDIESPFGLSKMTKTKSKFVTKTEPFVADLSVETKILKDTGKTWKEIAEQRAKEIARSKRVTKDTFGVDIDDVTMIPKAGKDTLGKTMSITIEDIPASVKKEVIEKVSSGIDIRKGISSRSVKGTEKVIKESIAGRIPIAIGKITPMIISDLSISATEQKTEQKTKQLTRQVTKQKQENIMDVAEILDQSMKNEQAQINDQIKDTLKASAYFRPSPVVMEGMIPISPIIRERPKIPTEKIISPFSIEFPEIEREKEVKGKGYEVYIKNPKSNKFSKITKNPITIKNALNLRNYAIDNSTSRQGFIKPTDKKPKDISYGIPGDYYERTQNKFRVFKQRKGVKIPLQNRRVIEKSKFINDTPLERKQLSIFRTMAKIERKKSKNIQSNKNSPVGLNIA